MLILTTFDLDEYVFEALRAGASGFLLKDTLPVDLLAAIRVVAGGEALLAPKVTRRLIEQFAASAGDGRGARDAAVPGIADAHRARARDPRSRWRAACRTPRSPRRCSSPTPRPRPTSAGCSTKLDARDRAQLVMIAYESGVVTPGATA